ncbi:SDR family oxidoreductase [Ruegeria sp. 2012CJ41-6]|uniref:SDR family oxidoreductase n=1 Tax=Ruegeria spongiae TaxID=2942209 RepID=A0ABT0Q309_9RHOB|nr:SDR family NAD(P)-dependent oxidoreductase [Ruegeria spongiae]MCL6284210.1 SDR family oxidoreductase [Ruegeria spongiae]
MTRGISAIVTGAASGIGAATALKLAQTGACLTLHTRRSAKRLEDVANQARNKGAEVETVIGDLAEPGTGHEIVAAHKNRFGDLDALVANAGFPLLVALDAMTPEDIAYAFRGNTQSLFELVQACHPLLQSSSCPRVVALSSFTAHVFRTDMPQFPASAASKGAVETAVRSLSLGLAKDGITVNCVVPGYIRKDAGTSDGLDEAALHEIEGRIPLKRLGSPQDIANCICFLISAEASYISGQTLHVNGGLI